MARHALLIGVSRFDDPSLPRLNAPPSDVQALADVLADPGRGAFDSVVTSLDDDLVTIRDKLSALLDERRPRDTVLLYYSGHGINAVGNQLFLATGTTRQDKPRARSLPASEIRDMMASSRAGQLIVVLDCCHSGAFIEGAKGDAAPVSAGTFSAGDGAEGEYVLMACNALQVALDGGAQAGGGLSRFTQWLVQGLLTGEAAPARPEITLDDLYVYLCRRAREAGSVMTPQRFVARSAGELVIAGNPGARPPELPAETLAQLADTDWKRRLEAIGTLQAFAREERLRPLVRETITARLAVERDRDVSEALEGLLAGLRPRPADPPPAQPQPQPQPAASAPAPAPGVVRPFPNANPFPKAWMPDALPPRPPPAPLSRAGFALDRWQTQIVSRLGLSVTTLSAAGGVLLAQRGKALRAATWTWWLSLCLIVVMPLEGVIARGNTYATPDVVLSAKASLMALLAGSIVGLCSRRQPPPAGALNEEDRKLVLGLTVVRCLWTEYERRLFRRSCWLVLVLSMVSLGLAGQPGR